MMDLMTHHADIEMGGVACNSDQFHQANITMIRHQAIT